MDMYAGRMSFAQIGFHPLGPQMPSRLFSEGFRQEFNTYLWSYHLSTVHRVHNRWRVSLQEQFRSSMLQLQSEEDKWKDDHNLRVGLDFDLLPILTLNTSLASLIFVDRQSGFSNDIRTQWGSFGFQLAPFNRLMLGAKVGPKWDTRFAMHDHGVSYNLQANADNWEWDGYDNSLSFALGQDRFPVRQNNDLNLDYSVQKAFAPGTADSLRLYTNSRRRDNYASEVGDIESLREKLSGFENILRYNVSEGVQLSVNNSLQYKQVEVFSYAASEVQRRRKRNDQISNNGLYLMLLRRSFRGNVNLYYTTQQQLYDIKVGDTSMPFSRRTALVTPNNESSRLFFSTGFGADISHADSISAYFSVSRFQYDTPDTNNFDDHDELRINSRLVFQHRFRPELALEIQTGVNLYHLVYVFGERSADNNWNRIFRLAPSVDYNPSAWFRLKQTFEVLANYVDYDFEDQNVLTKSFVFRKFAMDDSLRWSFSRRSSVTLDYRLQLEENGQLSWEDWTERLLVTRQSHWSRLLLNHSATTQFGVSTGYGFYLRDEWRHKTDAFGIERKEKYVTFSSHGPILRFWYVSTDRLRLSFDSARQAVDAPGQKRYYINTIDVHLNWFF